MQISLLHVRPGPVHVRNVTAARITTEVRTFLIVLRKRGHRVELVLWL
ncbi:hypothetical protein HW555_003649 [Spodoptera exigua]|uniref:Uncharacterized protein n=1 Tax=Spodoptera exigua TaxID=7107 RepID=A0A835L632_SPOEX|nr:hypothetical protein HW555_003649 [Spodoptera exigua]